MPIHYRKPIKLRLSQAMARWFSLRLMGFFVTGLLLLACFIFYYANLSLKNSRLAQKDWEYAFLIKDIMRQIPTLNPIENSKKYYYRLVYNPTAAQNIMSYRSRASASEIISYYQLYFNATNYSSGVSQTSEPVATFRNIHDGFDVYVKEYQAFRQVFIEYFP